MTPLITLKGITKSYFNEDLETRVLRGIDLTIDSGEFVAIMGPSGSGKSTLMHILGFLDVPTSGSYLFQGTKTRALHDDELAKIRAQRVSFIFQAFNLLPRTSVLENVMLPLIYHPTIRARDRKEKALQAIESVGLSDRAQYLTNQLSGGQQQRVAIARALVTEPEIIFADEPTGNLDSASGTQVMQILQQLDTKGHTVILVTHEQSTAEHAKRIIRLRDGEIESDEKVKKRKVAGKENLK